MYPDHDARRLHSSVLVTDRSVPRKVRKARERAARRFLTEEHARELEADRARRAVERAEAQATQYLPRAGEYGPAALRTPRPFRLPAHRDTSATLRAAYPFLAEGGLGGDGVYIGQDMFSGSAFVFDPWVLYQRGVITAPNAIIAGIVGSGKSALVKSLYTRELAFGRRVYIPGDPKGEHGHIAEAVGGKCITLGPSLPGRLNPLDEGYRPSSMNDSAWVATVTAKRRDLIGALAETVLERSLSPLEHTAIDLALASAVQGASVPILPMIVDYLHEPAPGVDARVVEDGRLVAHALRRLVHGDLRGLFDAPSTVSFDPSAPMISIDLSRVVENSTLISVLMTCASAWMESALLDPDGGKRMIVYDEAWRLMSHGPLLKRMDTHWRLARHYGICNVLVFHKFSDLETVGDQGSAMRALADSLLANAEVRITYRQEADQLRSTGGRLGLTGTELALLPGLGVGQGLWKVKESSRLIQHQMVPEEMRMFDTTGRMA